MNFRRIFFSKFFSIRQQIKLLKMLAEFEQVEETQKEIDQLNIDEDDQNKYIRQIKNRKKLDTLPVAFTSSSHPEKILMEPKSISQIEATGQTTLGSVVVESKQKKCGPSVLLEFKFHSNWGSQEHIGLTEVCIIILLYCGELNYL